VAYLLFRIADTIEDEIPGSVEQRALVLRALAGDCASENLSPAALRALLEGLPTLHENGCAGLLSSVPAVLAEYADLDPPHQSVIAAHLSRTSLGMADFLERDLSKAGLIDLRAYCYAVAGIVGEMCSALFIAFQPGLQGVRAELLRSSAAFGEGLQLVNIIRDANDDLHAGRCYIPQSVNREQLVELAREDLAIAAAYIQALERAGAHPGIVAFNTFNAALAHQTLQAVERRGAGAKVDRDSVAQLRRTIEDRVHQGQPLVEVVTHATRVPHWEAS
jgi:farnesyl-diphosphate farnesyltransferase